MVLNGWSSDNVPGPDLGRIQDLLDWLLDRLRGGHCGQQRGILCSALISGVEKSITCIASRPSVLLQRGVSWSLRRPKGRAGRRTKIEMLKLGSIFDRARLCPDRDTLRVTLRAHQGGISAAHRSMAQSPGITRTALIGILCLGYSATLSCFTMAQPLERMQCDC